jgi:hypothetical protein
MIIACGGLMTAVELLDAEHPHVGQAGGAALKFVRLQLSGLGLFRERLHLRGNGTRPLRSAHR